MSLRGEVGKTIEKVIARKARPRFRAPRKSTIGVNALKPIPNKPGYFVDKKGVAYRVVNEPITGHTLVRQDGARFKLNKSGKWVLSSAKSSGRKKR